jgi:hypothetical protein
MTASPYLRYDQVFVILRVNTSADQTSAPEAGVALLKALWSEAAAEAEVERLNQSNRERENVYFWKATRLERRLAQASIP